MRLFTELFKISNDTTILDIGGTSFNWQYISTDPQLTIINLGFETHRVDNIKYEAGDGTNLKYADKQFDLVYSNSVIEHLFTLRNQKRFATEVQRTGKSYFIQTPAKEFFIEPHIIAPFIHWLPDGLYRRLIRYCSVRGLVTRQTKESIDNFVDEVRLLTFSEFKRLFHDADIFVERFMGMPKSYIAYRTSDCC